MDKISKNSVVTLSYHLKDSKDQLIDSSDKTGPMIYIQGAKDILQGIEDAVNGLTVNEKVSITIPATEAYGDYDPQLLSSVPASAFQGLEQLYPGMQVQEETDSGPILVTIKDVTDDIVQIDTNHPLAGQDLTFHLVVKSVRPASKAELDHGHVHQHGDHH